ncbi:hypothetical protein [Microbulbifer rhizosphaerae]|uniref:Uncharacterized protein n=1 Tax=Microbulbifer rhizosphaerae TaxID=1562603 RepID=A0A7W4WG21_9GAMM|nr:hypothetical protein [Microbulbifer rhizosphaerae]MBB3063542.1 hypothetical protein [Microbulbifer rhizosphaerae]
MNCNRAKQELELMREQNGGSLLHHLRQCASCRDYAEELRVVRLLRSMPAPEPSEGFEHRVLRSALPQSRVEPQARLRGWQLATAASLLLAVMMAVPRWQSSQSAAPQIVSTLPVSVSLDSARPLEGAVIRVSLPSHLALDGYPGVQDLEWQANLNAGANRLTLPVRLQGAESGGEILIEVEHEGARKTFRVPVQFRPSGGAATAPIQKT